VSALLVLPLPGEQHISFLFPSFQEYVAVKRILPNSSREIMSRVSRNTDSVICLSALSSARAKEQYIVQRLTKTMERRLRIFER
jgi:hypothetical protein